MATIEQYRNGEAARSVRLAYEAMQSLDRPLSQTELAEVFAGHLNVLKPRRVNEEQALRIIERADRCAIGARLCACEFPDAPHSCAVFLEELADAMVAAGKARYASSEEAAAALAEHEGKPLVISRVSGKYREICRTWPKTCFYWNMEKHGMKCLESLESEDRNAPGGTS